MKKRCMYFAKGDIYQKIRDLGGTWNDGKDRPIVCLIQSTEREDLYWAIPVGNLNHRNEKAQKRIQNFMDLPEKMIESCYYHVGKTTTKSIFFISDVIPITKKYIHKGYLGKGGQTFEIKNKPLLAELERKLERILAYENVHKNSFRQHITDIKLALLEELDNSNRTEEFNIK